MTALLVTSIVALAALVVFQGLVLLEVVRQLSQIRRELDFDDRPVPVSVGKLAGKPLPEPARAVWSGNGDSRDGVLVGEHGLRDMQAGRGRASGSPHGV